MPLHLSQAVWAGMDLVVEPTSSKLLLCCFGRGTPGVSITHQKELLASHHKTFSLLVKADA